MDLKELMSAQDAPPPESPRPPMAGELMEVDGGEDEADKQADTSVDSKRALTGTPAMQREVSAGSDDHSPPGAPHGVHAVQPTLVSYFALNLFICLVGEGPILPDPSEAAHLAGGGGGASSGRVTERLKQLMDKIPRDQCFFVEFPAEGKQEFRLRIFVSSSEDSRAIDTYIKANPTQSPAPFILMTDNLPLAALYNPAAMDPSAETTTADRLRKQCKSRALKFVREVMWELWWAGVRMDAFRGRQGPMPCVGIVQQHIANQVVPIPHVVIKEAIAFFAADRYADKWPLLEDVFDQRMREERAKLQAIKADVTRWERPCDWYLAYLEGQEVYLELPAGKGTVKGPLRVSSPKELGVGAVKVSVDTDMGQIEAGELLKMVGIVEVVGSGVHPRDCVRLSCNGLTLGQAADAMGGDWGGDNLYSDVEEVVYGKGLGGPFPVIKALNMGEFDVRRGDCQHLEEVFAQHGEATFNQTAADFTCAMPSLLTDSSGIIYQSEFLRYQSQKLLSLLESIESTPGSKPFFGPIILPRRPSPINNLTTVKNRLLSEGYACPEDFATAALRVFAEYCRYADPNSEMVARAQSLASSLDTSYQSVVQDLKESSALVPESLAGLSQRFVDNWMMCDSAGSFIPPWFGADAIAPGGLFGVLIARPLSAEDRVGRKGLDGGVKWVSPRVKVEVLEEWHAQCVDSSGCRLPTFWIKSGSAWYRLGRPNSAYRNFLVNESAWLLATYRSALFLQQCPRGGFGDMVAVMAGKNWLRENLEQHKGSNAGAYTRLLPVAADVLCEKADMIASELANIHPELAQRGVGDELVTRFGSLSPGAACLLMTQFPARETGPDIGLGGAGQKRRYGKKVGGGGYTFEDAEEAGLGHAKRPAQKHKRGDEGIVSGGAGISQFSLAAELSLFTVPVTEEEFGARGTLNSIIVQLEREFGQYHGEEDAGAGGMSKSQKNRIWRCQWCFCTLQEGGGKGGGPQGPGTLCHPCSNRYRSGFLSPPVRGADGKYPCDTCNKRFDTTKGLGSHKRTCAVHNDDKWHCFWCYRGEESVGEGGKQPGPAGPNTLCSKCGEDCRNGALGPEGVAGMKIQCPVCEKQFDSIMGLGGHRRFCDGGLWACGWCRASAEESGGKTLGPDGPKTLCSSCGNRFRNGHTGPALKDSEGNFVCEDCNRRFETSAGLGGHRRFCAQITKGRNVGENGLIEDCELEAQAVAMPLLVDRAKVDQVNWDTALQVWDCLALVVGEALGEHLALSWETFENLVIEPIKVSEDTKAGLIVPMVEVLFVELPGAKEEVVFKGRPLNRFTWQELLRQLLATRAWEYATTLTPNISEDDAILCRPRRIADGIQMNSLAAALGEDEFEGIPPEKRLELLECLVYMTLDSTKVRKHIEKGVEEAAKLMNRKRDEVASRMKKIEQVHRGGVPAPAVAGGEGEEGEVEEEGHGAAIGGKKKKVNVVALRESQAEEVDLVDQRFRKLRRRVPTVRRECLGYDRHSRRYWLCGLEDSGCIGTLTGRVCLLVEPYVDQHSITYRGLPRTAGPGNEQWEVVRSNQDLDALLASLSTNGVRESLLRERIVATRKDLELGFRDGAFEIGAPESWEIERPHADFLRCEECGKIRRVPGPGGLREGGDVDGFNVCSSVMEGGCDAEQDEQGWHGGEEEDGWGTCEWGNPQRGWERRSAKIAGVQIAVSYHISKAHVVLGGGAGGVQGLRACDMDRCCLPAVLRSQKDVALFQAKNPGCSVKSDAFEFSKLGPQYPEGWEPAPPPPKEEIVVEKKAPAPKASKLVIPQGGAVAGEAKATSCVAKGKKEKKAKGGKAGNKKGKKGENVEDQESVKGNDGEEDGGGEEGEGEGGAAESKDGAAEKVKERPEHGGFGMALRTSVYPCVSNATRSLRSRGVVGADGLTFGESFVESLLAPCNDGCEASGEAETKERDGEMKEEKQEGGEDGRRRAFVGAKVEVGKGKKGKLSSYSSETGAWMVEMDSDRAEREVQLPNSTVKVLTVPEEPVWILDSPFLRVKRELLDMWKAMPEEGINANFARDADEWLMNVRVCNSSEGLNNLLLAFARAIEPKFIASWWAKFDGFSAEASDARCKILDSRGWRCALASMPGQTVCSRHLKKQFWWGGLFSPESHGGRQQVAGKEGKDGGGGKVVKVRVNMYLEVKWDGDWWQARVVRVRGKRCEVLYLGGEEEEKEWVDSKGPMLRMPSGDWARKLREENGEEEPEEEEEEEEEDLELEREREREAEEGREHDDMEDDDQAKEAGGMEFVANGKIITNSAMCLRVFSLDEAITYASPSVPLPTPQDKIPIEKVAPGSGTKKSGVRSSKRQRK